MSGGWSGECCAVDGVFTGKFVDRLPLFSGITYRQTTARQHRGAPSFCSARSARMSRSSLLIHAVEADQQEVIASKTAGQTVV